MWANPRFSSPSSARAGTRHSSSTTSPVCDVRHPTVSMRRVARPGAPVSTTNREMPLAPASGSVFAATTRKSAIGPLVTKVFVPDNVHPSPALMARVRTAATSDPPPGSVTASAPISSPATPGRSHRSLWSRSPSADRY